MSAPAATHRHALVTGANRGIGLAIARALSADGFHLTLLVRDAASAERARAELAGPSHVVVADVTDETAMHRACAEAVEAGGRVTALVNNAGSVESAPFGESSTALFRRMLDVHLFGAVHATHALLPAMLEARHGRIVNVASTAGVAGAAYVSAYVAAKHALVGLTRSLAKETAARGVTVNAVCPGYTETDLVAGSVERITARTGRSAEGARAAMLAGNPLGRFVTADEVAAAVRWLCTDAAASVTGSAIIIDGGETA